MKEEYILFKKKNCKSLCSKKVEKNSINCSFFGKCLIDPNSLCEHIDNPENGSLKKYRKFFEADRIARSKAGLKDKAGHYEFICPNCGTKCVGEWVLFRGDIHGSTGCNKCNIGLRI